MSDGHKTHGTPGTEGGFESGTMGDATQPRGMRTTRKGKFAVGAKVRAKSGAYCTVQSVNDDGTFAVITDDGKHAFNIEERDLKVVPDNQWPDRRFGI